MSETYVTVEDEDWGCVVTARVGDEMSDWQEWPFPRDAFRNRTEMRVAAEHKARVEAKRLGCDWGTNY